LVVFHLLDNVRGQAWSWQPQSVSRATLTGRTLSNNGRIRSIAFTGEYAKRDSHPPQWTDRGQQGHIEGEFDLDTNTGRITRFRAFADSQAWSDATYDRNFAPPQGRYPILTAMVEANDGIAREIPPEQAASGEYYRRIQLQVR
jgi:hypothetical protein